MKYSESLLTCIIISLGLWIYDTQTSFRIFYKEKAFELSQFKKKNYTLACKDTLTLNTIYLNDTSWFVYNYLKSEYFFIAQNEISKELIISMLSSDKQPLVSEDKDFTNISIDGFLNTRIENNHVKGKVKIFNKIVFFDIDPEKEIKTTIDINVEVTNFNSLLSYISNSKNYNSLLDEIVKDIISSTFEQSSEKYNKNEECEKLKSDLYVKKINIFKDCFIIVMGAPINYPDYNIYIQLTDNFQIEEVSIN